MVGGCPTVRPDLAPYGARPPHHEDLKRKGEVGTMVGDRVNDAPALAAADIGIAIGSSG